MQANVQTSNIDSESLPPPGKYLTFWLDDELFGIPVLKVREIMRICPITPVPRVPLYIKGVINLRGKILPVIDLRARLQMSAFNNHDRVCIIVVQYTNNIGEMNLIGMIVDAVDEVAFFGSSQMSITPDFGNTLDTRFIVGMAESKGGVKTILDIDKLLSSDDELQIKSKIQ